VRVGLLEAERVERHRESGRRVGLQVAEDGLRVLPLPREQVRGPLKSRRHSSPTGQGREDSAFLVT
jgi:hypothetical protein